MLLSSNENKDIDNKEGKKTSFCPFLPPSHPPLCSPPSHHQPDRTPRLGCFKMQKVKISRWGSPKIGYYTKLSHCKRNWDFSCKIVAPRNFFVFNGDFGGFQWGNFQNSEFAYYASKSGKCIKQTPTPPFWGDVGVKKWSQFFYSGT